MIQTKNRTILTYQEEETEIDPSAPQTLLEIIESRQGASIHESIIPAKCISPELSEYPGLCEVRYQNHKDDNDHIVRVRFLEGLTLRKNDCILLALPKRSSEAFVIGHLAETQPSECFQNEEEQTENPLSEHAPEIGQPLLPFSVIGICVKSEHLTLKNRCLVQWTDAEKQENRYWLPCLNGVTPQVHDNLLIFYPNNWSEPVIVGVLDSIKKKVDRDPVPGPAVQLNKQEALHILNADGTPLVEVRQGKNGPILRLMNEDIDIEVPGKLCFSAKSIDMAALQGEVNIKATDDVIVKGETIQLN